MPAENFGDILMNTAGAGIGQAINGTIGMLIARGQEAHNDNRQINMERRLQQIQLEGNRYMTDYNAEKQKEMWDYTNYENTVKHMKAAGINPALLYGKGGGGGATASIAPGSVNVGSAPKGGVEQIANQGMLINSQKMMAELQLLTAQKENIQADTANKQASTTNTGAQTVKTEAETQNVLQAYDNMRQDYDYKKLQMAMQNILNYEQQASQEDRLNDIHYDARTALEALGVMAAKNKVDTATVQSQINSIKAEAIGAVLQNELTKASTDKTKTATAVDQTRIKEFGHSLQKDWESLNIQQKEVRIKQLLQEFNTDDAQRMYENILKGVNSIQGLKPGRKTIIHNWNGE